jgi:hypothetical protein
MNRLDTSAGLSANAIDTIKYLIKRKVAGELPELPDAVETRLFLQGRTPWNFYWTLLNSDVPIAADEIILIEVTAKLKREFHHHGTIVQHRFRCKVRMTEDVYRPRVSIKRIA